MNAQVPSEVVNSSPIVVRQPKSADATCNFCTNRTAAYEISSLHPSRNLHICLCAECAVSLVWQIN